MSEGLVIYHLLNDYDPAVQEEVEVYGPMPLQEEEDIYSPGDCVYGPPEM